MPLICFASPKGGVGKSTLAANVACEIARTGRQVVALDLDPQNTLRLHFGMDLRETGGFMRDLPRQPDWRHVGQRGSHGVYVLPYGSSDMQEAISVSRQLGDHPALLSDHIADMLAQPGLVVVADTEPGPSASLAAILPSADLLVSVLLVDATSSAVVPSIENGRAYGLDWISSTGSAASRQVFVLNQFDPKTRLGPTIAQGLARHLGGRLLGVVHRDEHVGEAIAAQKPVADYAAAAQATHDIRRIAEAITSRISVSIPKKRMAMVH
jgi:cellulose synthase operon protein YhjQ